MAKILVVDDEEIMRDMVADSLELNGHRCTVAANPQIALETAFDLFYNSKVCELLSDKETGFFTYAPQDLAEMVSLK